MYSRLQLKVRKNTKTLQQGTDTHRKAPLQNAPQKLHLNIHTRHTKQKCLRMNILFKSQKCFKYRLTIDTER